MKWGQLGLWRCAWTQTQGQRAIESASQWFSWPGTVRLTAGCSPSGMTEVNVHPVTAKWPEGIGAALQEESLTYEAI